jgi:hypothetical protein
MLKFTSDSSEQSSGFIATLASSGSNRRSKTGSTTSGSADHYTSSVTTITLVMLPCATIALSMIAGCTWYLHKDRSILKTRLPVFGSSPPVVANLESLNHASSLSIETHQAAVIHTQVCTPLSDHDGWI